MSFNADFAILYACALTLFGAVIVWALPMAFMAVFESVTAWVQKRRDDGSARPTTKRPYRPLPPRVPGIHFIG